MRYSLIFIFFSIVLAGCEEITDSDVNVNFKELIVVQSELKGGAAFKGVSFTKTLPLGEPYDIKKAELTDVKAYLKINGIQIVPLHYNGNGIYKPLYFLSIKEGNTYELFAEVKNKLIYSITRVPFKPVVKTILYHSDYFISAEVVSKKDEAYGAAWIVGSVANIISSSEDFYSINAAQNNEQGSLISVRTQEIPPSYRNTYYRSLTYIKIYAFDKPFLEFFKSKDNNQSVDNVFTQSGGAVAWNVYGEDAIGLFIGVSEGDLIRSN
ncbi:MAG TPA: hypothetical protein VMT35_18100 [Ignavibacteriaceae bacterium]|nr:hypothetical protein [Ignavibacteriaceae bacterium]